MTIEEALRLFLVASPELKALVGERIYVDKEPQNKMQPSIIMQRERTEEQASLQGLVALTDVTLNVECRAITSVAAGQIAELVKEADGGLGGRAFKHYWGPMGELYVRRSRVLDDRSVGPYPPQSGDDVALYARELQVSIVYSETPCGG